MENTEYKSVLLRSNASKRSKTTAPPKKLAIPTLGKTNKLKTKVLKH